MFNFQICKLLHLSLQQQDPENFIIQLIKHDCNPWLMEVSFLGFIHQGCIFFVVVVLACKYQLISKEGKILKAAVSLHVRDGSTHAPQKETQFSKVISSLLQLHGVKITEIFFFFQESISTCRFAQRVALIKNEAVLNEETDPKLVRNVQGQRERDCLVLILMINTNHVGFLLQVSVFSLKLLFLVFLSELIIIKLR